MKKEKKNQQKTFEEFETVTEGGGQLRSPVGIYHECAGPSSLILMI